MKRTSTGASAAGSKANLSIGKFCCFLVTVVLLELAPPVNAQRKAKPKVSVLTPAEQQWDSAAFREGLRSLGYIDGSNILIDVHSADGKLEQLPELAAALIHMSILSFA